MGRYVALLRGINVGGKNLIKMADLRACFEDQDFRNVATYIQSGNVLFESGDRSSARLAQRIEDMLAATFDYQPTVVVLTRNRLRSIVDEAPDGFGAQPRRMYDVLFLKPPLTAAAALESVPVKEGVDQAHAGKGALYYSRLVGRASQSRLGRVASLPIYQSMTIRSWGTTTKLLQMMDGP